MTAARARVLALVSLAAAIAAACGAKGPPQAPLRPIPAAVADFSIERDGPAIKLRILIPDVNDDGSAPAAIERIDIYALTQPFETIAPGNAELMVPANVIGSIPVRPAPSTEKPEKDAPKPDAPPDPRPAPGDVASYIDLVEPDAASVRYFAAVAATGRRRSRTGAILPVPLGAAPGTPSNVKIDYTEQKLTLTWDALSAESRYIIEDASDQAGSPARLSTAPQDATAYEEAVAFGKARCLTVRAADVKGAVVSVGAASAPACVTPRDRFPPPVPSGLTAVPADPGAGIDLVWSSVQASDLGGYVVLRGDGPDGTLQPITAAPVTSSSYRDTTARPGSQYVYAVVSVDKAVPPNKSDASNKYSATARTPAPSVRHER